MAGFSSFLNGEQVGRASLNSDRREEQTRLKNLLAGFEQLAGGKYEPNATGRAGLKADEEKIKFELEKLKTQNELLAAQSNAKDMTEGTKLLAMGKVEDAARVIDNNPALKAKLAEQFDVVKVMPVDWVNDRKLVEDAGVSLSDDITADPSRLNALNSSFFKVLDKEGKQHIVTTLGLMQDTGFNKYASTADNEGLAKRFNMIQEILKGHIMSPEERKLKENSTAISLNTSDSALKLSDLQKSIQDSIFNDPTLSDSEKLTAIMGNQGKTQKELEQEYKTRQARAKAQKAEGTLQADIAKAKAEAKSAESKVPVVPTENSINIVDKYVDVPTKELTGKDERDLRNIDKMNGGETAVRKDKNTIKTKASFAKLFEAMIPKIKKIDFNAVEKLKSYFTRVVEIKDGNSEEARAARAKALNYLAIQTGLGTALASYIKEMSGAAVTDAERKLYSDLVKGGDWSNGDVAINSIKSFVDTIRSEGSITLNNIRYSYPWTYRTLKRETGLGIKSDPSKPLGSESNPIQVNDLFGGQ